MLSFKPLTIILWCYSILFQFAFSAFHIFFFTFYSGNPYESTVFITHDGSVPSTYEIILFPLSNPFEYIHFSIISALMGCMVHYGTILYFRNRLANSFLISMEWAVFLTISTISYLFLFHTLHIHCLYPTYDEFMKVALLFSILYGIVLLPFVLVFYPKIVRSLKQPKSSS